MNIESLDILRFIAISNLIFWTGVWFTHIIALYQAFKKINRPKSLLPDHKRPGITILKPLSGVNCNLSKNLETCFEINYPTYELVFCLENERDPASNIVANLIKQYPNVSARLVCGVNKLGVNRKVNNVCSGYMVAQYDIVVISDDTNNVHPDTLTDMISYLKGNVGIVHQMPFSCDRPGYGSALEKVNIGTAYARLYLTMDFVQFIPFLTGMSFMFRRSTLDKFGGLAVIAGYLAEDLNLAQVFMKNGYKAVVCSLPVTQNAGSISTRAVINRTLRWAHLRIKSVPPLLLLEPLGECFVIGPLACWALYYLFDLNLIQLIEFLCAHFFVWFNLDFLLLRRLERIEKQLKFSLFVIAWIHRGIFHIFVNLVTLTIPIIRWKERLYHVSWGGKATDITKPTKNLF